MHSENVAEKEEEEGGVVSGDRGETRGRALKDCEGVNSKCRVREREGRKKYIK